MSELIGIKLGGYQSPDSVHTRALKLLRDSLLDLAGDRIEVDVQANVAEFGHKTADLPRLVESGVLDGSYISSSYLADTVPALSMFDIPFAAPNRAQAFVQLDGALGARFKQEIESKTGLAMLGIWDNGMRHVSTAGRPMHRPSQCEGLVLRTLPNENHQRVFRSLGFDPRVIDAKDLSASVARGDVDAQENPLTNTYNFGLYKALPTITLTRHLMGIALVLFNKERFLSWPEEIRALVTQAVDIASRAQRKLAQKEDEACAEALLSSGAQLIELSEDDRAAWRAAAHTEILRSRAQLDPELLALLNSSNRLDEGAMV